MGGAFVDRGGKPWHKECVEADRVREDCAVCGKGLSGRVIRALGKGYHSDCFACTVCRKSIDGQFVMHEGKPHHSECIRHEKAKKGDCNHCGKGIFAGESAVRLAGGELMHASCFSCAACSKAFA